MTQKWELLKTNKQTNTYIKEKHTNYDINNNNKLTIAGAGIRSA